MFYESGGEIGVVIEGIVGDDGTIPDFCFEVEENGEEDNGIDDCFGGGDGKFRKDFMHGFILIPKG